MECLNRHCTVAPQVDKFHGGILGHSQGIAKGRKSTVGILWRGFVKSRQPLDLPKKQGGYGRVRSPSSRGREPLDRWSVSRQPSSSTGVAQDLSPCEQRKTPEKTSGFWSSGFIQVKWLDFAFGRSPREDLDHPSVETRGGHRGIGSRDIDIPVDKRSGKSIVKTPA
jgi:hypothetical protein